MTGTVLKTYDGNTSATLAANNYITGAIALDNVSVSTTAGTYDNKNAGAGKAVTVNSLAITGAVAGNYNLITGSVSGAVGQIDQRAITFTAATNTKIYDGSTSVAATPTITAGTLMAGDSASGLTEAYSSKNAGTGLTLTPSGTISDGNFGNNYAYT